MGLRQCKLHLHKIHVLIATSGPSLELVPGKGVLKVLQCSHLYSWYSPAHRVALQKQVGTCCIFPVKKGQGKEYYPSLTFVPLVLMRSPAMVALLPKTQQIQGLLEIFAEECEVPVVLSCLEGCIAHSDHFSPLLPSMHFNFPL